jgi:hypothetical protein
MFRRTVTGRLDLSGFVGELGEQLSADAGGTETFRLTVLDHGFVLGLHSGANFINPFRPYFTDKIISAIICIIKYGFTGFRVPLNPLKVFLVARTFPELAIS